MKTHTHPMRIAALVLSLAAFGVLTACGALPNESARASLELAPADGAPDAAIANTADAGVPPVELPTLRVGAIDVDSLDPAHADSISEREIADLLFDPLVRLDALGQPAPGAARSWSTWDNINWTFRLDPDGHFTNGELVTAESFVAGMMYLADPDSASPNAYLGIDADIEGFEAMARGEADTISGVVATEPHTLVITLNEANALLPSMLAHSAFSPRSAAALADAEAAAVMPVGNGAFVLGEAWDRASPLQLSPSGEGTHEVRFEFFASTDAMLDAGMLDFAHVPESRLSDIRTGAKSDRLLQRAAGGYNYIAFPAVEPFTDPLIRRALSLAIDRDRLVHEVFAGAMLPASGFAPAGSMGSTPGDCSACTYDPDEARRLITEAGGLDSDVLELAFNTGRNHETWVQAVGAQWSEVFGVEVVFKGEGPAPYFEAIAAGTHTGPYRLAWSTDYPHAMSLLGPLFVGESNNTPGYQNEAVDEAAAKLHGLENPYTQSGSDLVSIMTDELNADMPVIPVFTAMHARMLYGAAPEVALNLDGSLRLRDAILPE